MSSDNSDRPPKPRLTLRVGVTGKRELTVTDDIRRDVDQVLARLADALSDCFEKNARFLAQERPVLRVVCGLAEGADQLVAAAAKRMKDATVGVDIKLTAILPFPADEFIKDFERDPNRHDAYRTPEERAAIEAQFKELLAEARKTAVLEVDDEALRPPEHRALAYVGLRDLLVQHSDLIVAVFDEEQEGKPGGSADVTRLAAQEQVPVVRISTAGKPIALLRAAEPDEPDQRPRADDKPLDLDELIAAILSPPRAGSQPDQHGAHGSSRSGRQRLKDFFGETGEPVGFAWMFKACRAALLRWEETRRGRFFAAVRAFRKAKERYLEQAAERKAQGAVAEPSAEQLGKLWAADRSSPPDDSKTRFRDILLRRFALADRIAVCFADNTRSAYIAIAYYGALAVFVGLLAVLFWGKMAGLVKAMLLTFEGFTLLLIALKFYRHAHGESWHERMVEYRVLAELLRHQQFMYVFGAATRSERGDRSWRGPDAWLGWYGQSTTRELGFPTARLCRQYRRAALAEFKTEIAGQLRYNRDERTQNTAIDSTLGVFIERAFTTAVWVAFGGAAVVVLLWAVEMCSPPHSAAEAWLDHFVKPVLTIFLAFVPALIAAVHGIRFQMEFGSAAKRADATFKELKTVDEKLDKLLQSADPGRKASEAIVRAANDAMVTDLSGWSTVYKHKAAELV